MKGHGWLQRVHSPPAARRLWLCAAWASARQPLVSGKAAAVMQAYPTALGRRIAAPAAVSRASHGISPPSPSKPAPKPASQRPPRQHPTAHSAPAETNTYQQAQPSSTSCSLLLLPLPASVLTLTLPAARP